MSISSVVLQLFDSFDQGILNRLKWGVDMNRIFLEDLIDKFERRRVMLRSKPLIVFTLVFALFALFSAGEVMAFSDEPCYGLNYDYCDAPAMSAIDGGWTVTLSEPVVRADGKVEWLYSFRSPGGGFTGANFIAFLVPDCCKDTDKIVFYPALSAPANITEFGVSDGETTLNFGRYNNQAFVLKGTPDSTGDWLIVTDTHYKTRSTIIIKEGNQVHEFEMAVFGCPPAPPPPPLPEAGRNFTQCINFGEDTPDDPNDDVSFYVVRTSTLKGCAERVWSCNALRCPGCTNEECTNTSLPEGVVCEELLPEALPANVVFTGHINPVCQDENTEVTQWPGSIYYLYTLNSGGVTRKICYDVEQSPPVRVHRDCCKTPIGPLCPQ